MKIHQLLVLAFVVPALAFGGAEPFVALELPNSPANPRNSEGDFAVLKDGSVLFVYSHYTKGAGGDNDPAVLSSRISKDGGRTWSAESEQVIANEGGMNVMCASLLRLKDGALALFYGVKNSEADCRPVMRVSRDEGKSWSESVKCIPDAERGYYVFENCRAERLSNGRIILPLSLHVSKNGRINDGFGKLDCWYSDDEGQTWRRGAEPFGAVDPAGNRITLQEPGIVELKDGRVLMYARTVHGRQWFFYSSDKGVTWSAGRPSPLIGPCSPATLKRLSNGDLVAVWNDHAEYPEYAARDGDWGIRVPMSVAISKDDGVTWHHRRVIGDNRFNGWYCYFGVLEHQGNLLIGYCAEEQLKYARVAVVPISWIYEGCDRPMPARSFAGVREGAFKHLSTVAGVWSAKTGNMEVCSWDKSPRNKGRGVHILGGENREAYFELPIGADMRSLRLFANRTSAEGPYDFKIEGRAADGEWQRLFEQDAKANASILYPIRLEGVREDMTVLRFVCTSAGGVFITD